MRKYPKMLILPVAQFQKTEITQGPPKGKSAQLTTKEIFKKYTQVVLNVGTVAYEYLKIVKIWNIQ